MFFFIFSIFFCVFFFNDTATTEIYTLSLHDALPTSICSAPVHSSNASATRGRGPVRKRSRSEEHTSELQSRLHLVCRLLLEKTKRRAKRPVAATKKESATSTNTSDCKR